jgi:16S rRNA (guanine527-N7)-methyltransferase
LNDTPESTDSDTLPAALARAGIELAEDQIEQLDRYCRLLWDWNEKLNLTRHTTYEKFTSRDIVDSQALEQFLDAGGRVLDVGTGGGVPGIVLSILRPDLSVELCESMAKKAKAVQAIVSELGLPISVHHASAQQVLAEQNFEELVVRAVAPLANLLTWLEPHWGAFDRLLVIKGPAWVNERHEARERGLLRKLELRKIYSYPMPGTDSESVVLSIVSREM